MNTGATATASAIYANNTGGSAFGTGTVSIGAASATTFSTLAGSFTTSGATSIAGRLSPGNGTGLTAATAGIGSIGTDNFGGNLTLSSSTTSSLYLEASANGVNDELNVGGALTLAGTVYIATTNGYTIQPGDTFTFANYGTVSVGTVTYNTTGAALASGVTLTESFVANANGSGGEFIVSAIPEPGTWALLGLGSGMLALGAVRSRRRA